MDPNTATLWSGVISALGGVAGAAGAYCAAVYQTKKMIKHERDTKVQDRKILKMDELKAAVFKCREQLTSSYKSIHEQKTMVQKVIEKKYNVFQKQDFINNSIEENLIKSVFMLQNLRVLINSDRDSLPIRMDELEFLTSCRKMERVLEDFIDLKDLLVTKRMTLDEFSLYCIDLYTTYEKAKIDIDKFVTGPMKYIGEEISNNFK